MTRQNREFLSLSRREAAAFVFLFPFYFCLCVLPSAHCSLLSVSAESADYLLYPFFYAKVGRYCDWRRGGGSFLRNPGGQTRA